MDTEKEKQEISLIGRIFSLEALLLLMGFFCILAGLIYGEMEKILWGLLIIGTAVLLNFLRKKGLKFRGREDDR
ncbi:MAG TPA: hypothetical protein VMJ66_05845 [Geobacteraceae bacterium]|nr:hypothetical protein [Geobacteraceae bacterium]